MSDTVPLWTVVQALLGPVAVGCFWLLWNRMSMIESAEEAKRREIFDALGKHLAEDHAYHVDAERRFVPGVALIDLRADLRRLEDRVDSLVELRAVTGE